MYLDLAALFGDLVAERLRAHRRWFDPPDDEDDEDEDEGGDDDGGDDGSGDGGDSGDDSGDGDDGDSGDDDDDGDDDGPSLESPGGDDTGWGGPGGWDSGDTRGSDEADRGGDDTGWGGPGGWDTGGSDSGAGDDDSDRGDDDRDDIFSRAKRIRDEIVSGAARASTIFGDTGDTDRGYTAGTPSDDYWDRAYNQAHERDVLEDRGRSSVSVPTVSGTATLDRPGLQGTPVDRVITDVQDRIQRMFENTVAEPGKLSGKQEIAQNLALRDWQRESGRRAPDVNDPRDMQNYARYVNDWVGRAKDFSDPATGMEAIKALREAAMTKAKERMEQEARRPATTATAPGYDRYSDDLRGRAQTARERAMPPGPVAPGDEPLNEQRGARSQADEVAFSTRLSQAVADGAMTPAEAERQWDEYKKIGSTLAGQRGGVAPLGGPDYSFGNEALPVSTSLASKAMASGMDVLDAATVALLGAQQGGNQLVNPGEDSQAKFHLASAISSGEEWAKPALTTIAQMAWWRESGGQEGPPEAAPQTYVNDWISGWRAGEQVPLADNLNRQLREQGVWAPGSPLGGSGDWRAVLAETTIDQSRLMSDPKYRQMMDTKLTYAEAEGVCGPIAAMAFAQANNGQAPTLGEAKRLAEQVGWNPNKGMAGIQSQLSLVQKMGVDAEIGDATIPRMAKALETGPVIVNTGAHYYLVSDYNPKNGRFFVGVTGRVMPGGGDWMSLNEMGQASIRMGKTGVNGAIYMKGGASSPPQSSQMQAMSAPEPLGAQEGAYNVYTPPANGQINERDDRATNGTSPDEIEDYIRRAAAARGLDPDQAYAVARHEGSLNHERVYNPVLKSASGQPSWGPFQLHVEGAHLGDAYIRDTRGQLTEGLHPRDPKGWKMAVDYALDTVAKDGSWNQWYAADKPEIRKWLPNGRKTTVKGEPIGFSDEALHYAGVQRKSRS